MAVITRIFVQPLHTRAWNALARVVAWCGDCGRSRSRLLVSAAPPRFDLSCVRGSQNLLRHPKFLERVLQSRVCAGRSVWTASVLPTATLLVPHGLRHLLSRGGGGSASVRRITTTRPQRRRWSGIGYR